MAVWLCFFCATGRRLKDYLSRGKVNENPLAYYEENLDSLEELAGEISRQIRNESVDDYASGELCQIRSQIVKCREKMKQKAEQVMRANKNVMADNYCTLSSGRICVPVKKEYRMKIPGSVIDKSATGNTLFIEPNAVLSCYEELQLLNIREENEVYRILYTLTAMAADAAPKIQENIRIMEKLDFIFSKGKLSMDLNGAEPKINTERRIILKDADICMNDSYLCDIGDGQNLTENLSTFSAHIKNVLEILKEAGKDSLIIMDELGSGTDPAEGMGIAVAVLEELRKSGANFLVTTHYPEVKEYAKKARGMINARMTFDKETLKPAYQMVLGEAGESCAFLIAGRLGMPDAVIETAVRAAYGEEAVRAYRSNKRGAVENPAPKNGFLKSYSAVQPEDEKGQGGRNRNKIIKARKKHPADSVPRYQTGDRVMVYPDKKIGIVCMPANEKGVLRVQMPHKKIWINHKRVKLHVPASQLYPEDYDFSILFDSVEHRKARHNMERKYTEEIIQYEEL